MNITKVSQTLPTPVHDALSLEARLLGREPNEHIQRILIQHVINNETIAYEDAERLRLVQHVVDQCVWTARSICRDGDFSEDITLHAIQRCTRDPSWLRDYANCIEDDVYKHGNPLKGSINRTIGAQIRAGIGGTVKKDSNGKPMMKRVLGEVIQSYTLFDTFDSEAVHRPGIPPDHDMGDGQTQGDSLLHREPVR